ncbi:hypothetical protein TPHA_0L01930 [Tetrapisispora phaffii CBS 4417]|uniref:ATPase expression protein 1 n=1 Tax=Tetrapisispora phaffii (strain ATCC 24235 / CBS 4417 / NBRC 1672 / NRRL Y-8282 / UCD 70-5) TaxID=1071381 RepID=G8C068_TETPH|nr:hypothetical protein TPHA_0L01930 [Tetrapisispora phaffii CBS 4417]CCE65546.1 hypothetical protein TPHA_0L01930 [Tetrapisispora phaffii CBS 4417]
MYDCFQSLFETSKHSVHSFLKRDFTRGSAKLKITMNRQNVRCYSLASQAIRKGKFSNSMLHRVKYNDRGNSEVTKIAHPFYKPSKIEGMTLCCTEVKPQLLSGKGIMPIMKTDQNQHTTISFDNRLTFKSVRNISKWIKNNREIIKEKNMNIGNFISLTESAHKHSKVKINIFKYDSLKNFINKLENNEEISLNVNDFDSVANKLCKSEDSKYFLEDFYLYILQNHIKSDKTCILLIKSVENLFQGSINNIRVIDDLLLQIFHTVEENNIDSEKLRTEMMTFLNFLEDVFNNEISNLGLSSTTKQHILNMYIKSGCLDKSKTLLFNIIENTNNLNKTSIVTTYLNLIDRLSVNWDDAISRKMEYAINIGGILNKINEPKVFEFYIRNCRHYKELEALVQIIVEKEDNFILLDNLKKELVNKAGNLSTRNTENIINLSMLYNTLETSTTSKIPKSIAYEFIKVVIAKGAFNFASNVIDRNGLKLETPLIFLILRNMKSRRLSISNRLIFQNSFIRFMENYILPTLRDFKNLEEHKLVSIMHAMLLRNNDILHSVKDVENNESFFDSIMALYRDCEILDASSFNEYMKGNSEVRLLHLQRFFTA